MSLIITTDNMDVEEIPTGEIMARLYQIYDIGYQAMGEGNPPRREFVFLFELNAPKKDGKPHLISQRFTASMHPKANLRGFIEGWRGAPYSDEDVRVFDAAALVGRYAFITVVKKAPEKGKKEWAEIFSIRKKGDAQPFMSRMQPGFVPDWVNKAIARQLPPPDGNQHDQGATGARDMPSRPAGSPGTGQYVPPDNRLDF